MFIATPTRNGSSPVGAAWFCSIAKPLPKANQTCRPYGACDSVLGPISINMPLLRSSDTAGLETCAT
jgi:hypothetical protein